MSSCKLDRDSLSACCGCNRWVNEMLARQPFPDASALHAVAEALWWSLDEASWREAFAKHPKIGDRPTGNSTHAGWSRQEQSAVSNETTVAASLQSLNIEYQRRFGYIFIVCATGKSASEILALLEERLNHQPDHEISIAAAEQAKIMHLRLDKALSMQAAAP